MAPDFLWLIPPSMLPEGNHSGERLQTRLLSDIFLTAIGHKSHLKFAETVRCCNSGSGKIVEKPGKSWKKLGNSSSSRSSKQTHRAKGNKSNKISRWWSLDRKVISFIRKLDLLLCSTKCARVLLLFQSLLLLPLPLPLLSCPRTWARVSCNGQDKGQASCRGGHGVEGDRAS